MIEITCDMCMDLMPLVQDGIASEDSRTAVLAHLENCGDCRAMFEGEIPQAPGKKNIVKELGNRLKIFGKGGSWGGYESLVQLPFHGVGQEDMDMMGADPRLIRIYCGLEGAENLIADLEQALEQALEGV